MYNIDNNFIIDLKIANATTLILKHCMSSFGDILI